MLDLQLFNNDIKSVIFSKIDKYCDCNYYYSHEDFYWNGDYIDFNIALFHPILLDNIIKKNDLNILRFFLIRMKLFNRKIIKLIFNTAYSHGNFKIIEWTKSFIVKNNIKFTNEDYNCICFSSNTNKNMIRCYNLINFLLDNKNVNIYIDKNIRIKNNKKENSTMIKLNYFKNEQEFINSNNLCSFCYINNENLNKYEDDNKLIFCYCNSCKNKIKKEVKYNDNLYVKYIRDKTINKLIFEI